MLEHWTNSTKTNISSEVQNAKTKVEIETLNNFLSMARTQKWF